MDTDALNAFATGRNPNHSAVCVTSGLLKKMDKYEIEGVLGHELSHIKNYDILLQTVIVVMVGFISILSDLFARGFIGRRSSRDNDDNKAGAIIMLIGLVFIILSPIFANLVKLAISRNREYLADARSVEFTRNPSGLISALEKIRDDSVQMSTYSKTTASLFISSPDKKEKNRDSLLSTHPNINNRINRLRNIN
jgi:Heat shock protein. Metallo peptidase. MEROPS family M48B